MTRSSCMVFLFALLGNLVLMSFGQNARGESVIGMQANGTRVEDSTVSNWGDIKATPSLKGQKLLDEKKPFRWLLHPEQSLAQTPPAYVEFTGGDRLPGKVVGVRSASESIWNHLPPHLLVEPAIPLHWPDHEYARTIRVRTEWVQRVVWEPEANTTYQPGVLFLRDGRRVRFRTVRWNAQSVSILQEDTIQEFPLAHLSEIHLPSQDPWETYYSQLAVLSPDCSAQIIQAETTDGLIATTSTERFQPHSRGDKRKSENWYHLLQPAWSLDPLWVRYPSVRSYRFSKAHEVPLTRIVPEVVKQESVFSSAWQWQRNRNVQSKPLRNAVTDFGWGFGVQGTSELSFTLPKLATKFSTRMGLDQLAGQGGSVQAEIHWNGKQLFKSPVLIGSELVVDSGSFTVPADPENRKLTLRVDALATTAPDGADPFDIRDIFNWIEPEVLLDVEKLKLEVRQRAASTLGEIAGWGLTSDPAELDLVNYYDTREDRDPRFERHWKLSSPFTQISNKIRVDKQDRFLALMISRLPGDETASRVLVRLNNEVGFDLPVPERQSWSEPDPLLVPVEKFQGKRIQVDVAFLPDANKSQIECRGMTLVKDRPGLVSLFQDELNFAKLLNQGKGQANVIHEEAYQGAASIALKNEERSNPAIEGWQFPVREHPRLGEYRYLVFSWKMNEGKLIGLEIGHDGNLGATVEHGRGLPQPERRKGIPNKMLARNPRRYLPPDTRGEAFGYRYDSGMGKTEYGRSARRLNTRPPLEWERVDRDLFGDFGNFSVTGLGLLGEEGSTACFDHIFLARRHEDIARYERELKLLETPETLPPGVLKRTTEPVEYGEIFALVAPGFGVVDSNEGVWEVADHAGKTNLVRTFVRDAKNPVFMRRTVTLSSTKKSKLKLLTSREVQHDHGRWKLVVNINGEKKLEKVINKQTTPEDWAALEVDLNPYKGQTVLIELEHRYEGTSESRAFWKEIRIVEE